MKYSVIGLSLASMNNRRLCTFLCMFSIAMSVALLIGVQRIREGARESFNNTVSGTDLIVGARTGPVQLLLYSVFHMGNPPNNLSWHSYQTFSQHPEVAWTVPLSLGDSHRGFRVVGTDEQFFRYFRYGQEKQPEFCNGQRFISADDVVIGSDVAKKFSYQLGMKIILSHGISDVSFHDHDDTPFRVSGILCKTGTPVDRSLFVNLAGLDAIHHDMDHSHGASSGHHHHHHDKEDIQPSSVSAMLIGLRSRTTVFHVQREINHYTQEALTALMPAMTLSELWDIIGIAEVAMFIVSLFVVFAGILGMLSSLLTTLNERRRELAIIRSLGASPADLFLLLLSESLLLGLGGCLMGMLLVYVALWIFHPLAESWWGLSIPVHLPNMTDALILGGVLLLSTIAGCLPGLKAYRQSLSDGLTIRI
ncbi:MAG: ABC transporter permease [Deltaproteobacteria bacterium]|nr:ABC transporter permease [Deltaproteobacteria bacterium]